VASQSPGTTLYGPSALIAGKAIVLSLLVRQVYWRQMPMKEKKDSFPFQNTASQLRSCFNRLKVSNEGLLSKD
jgi:hypothetical protein